MTKARTGDRSKRLLIFFGLGIMIFALALPMLALMAKGGSQPPVNAEAHQQLVAEVVMSSDPPNWWATPRLGATPTHPWC